jgi:hypothetical protein
LKRYSTASPLVNTSFVRNSQTCIIIYNANVMNSTRHLYDSWLAKWFLPFFQCRVWDQESPSRQSWRWFRQGPSPTKKKTRTNIRQTFWNSRAQEHWNLSYLLVNISEMDWYAEFIVFNKDTIDPLKGLLQTRRSLLCKKRH